MGATNPRLLARQKRKKRIRKRIIISADRPRLSVFRSAKHMYAQIVDDISGNTLVAASSLEKEVAENKELKNKTDRAKVVGQMVAARAKEKGISRVVFDRNGFLYHGRVKAVSDGARKAGLEL